MQDLGIPQENLKRDLKNRHIQLIAIGGIIGVGLFLGSASAIKVAGPALILAYALGGIATFFVGRCIGEIAVEYPVSSSFAGYARAFFGPCAGFITGWNYWYFWTVIAMCEISAVAMYFRFWWPDLQQWIPAFLSLAGMAIVNMIAVKLYGEFEFWFALIKIVTIILFLFMGGAMILFGLGNAGVAVGISNLWTHGGFMPYGIVGLISALVMVHFSTTGIELVSITAGEASNPEKTIPNAINSVFWRITLFYVGSMFVVMSVYPWNEISKTSSPFVQIFSRMGIDSAAGIMNAVLITSAASCCNSGIYVTGRMLYALAIRNEAPAFFGKLSAAGVPRNGILFTCAVAMIGVLLNYVMPEKVFNTMVDIAVSGSLWTWFMIAFFHAKWRKSLTAEQFKNLKFPAPFYPLPNIYTVVYLVTILVIMLIDPDSRAGVLVTIPWFVGLYIAYKVLGIEKKSKTAADGIKTEW